MKRNLFIYSKCLLLSIALVCKTLIWGQSPGIEWQKSLGGSDSDFANSIQQTADGGYILAGWSYSFNGDLTVNYGSGDVWVVKLDNNGNIIWQNSLGGSVYDGAYSIQQTSDSGYILMTTSYSNDGDVTGNHGGLDIWVVKLADNGNITWQKSLGGSSTDIPYSVQQTSDNGYILAGVSESNNGDVTGNHGNGDAWVVKLDSNGNITWQKSLGGSNDDSGYAILQTGDGGYVLAGTSNSNNGDVTGNHGLEDTWVVKLANNGNITWQKSLGGSNTDIAYSIQQTADKGYILAGTSNSNNGDVTGNHGGDDAWVVKLADNGNLTWQKSLGGISTESGYSIQQTDDGGYILAGENTATTGDVTGNHGGADLWIVKLANNGNLIWQKSLGGSGEERGANSIQQTADGGYILAGGSDSNDGDVTGNHGTWDAWVIKLSSNLIDIHSGTLMETVSLYPNPGKEEFILTELAEDLYPLHISVADVLGREVYRQEYPTPSQTINLHLQIPNGTYHLSIQSEKCTIDKKFVIE